jgi:O-antigen/teichoic acid export membrane protein
MKNSRFYSALGLLIILNVIIKPVWIFGIDRQVQNVVGHEVYGRYFALFNLSIVFSFLLDLGLTAYFNRQLATQKSSFVDKAGSFLFIKLAFAVLYAALVFTAALLSGIDKLGILVSIVLIQIFTSLFVFLRSIITAHQWFKTDAWLSVLDKTFMILLCGSLLYFHKVFGQINLYKFLFTQVACTALAVICALVILLRRPNTFSVAEQPFFVSQILKAAFPFALVVLLMSIHVRLDGFLLERLHPNGSYEAGIYAAAYRLLDAANMVGYLFASFLLPYMAYQWSGNKEIQVVILTTRHFLLLYAFFIVVTVFFLAPWLQQILYHNENKDSIKVLQWCMLPLIGYSLTQIYGTVMTATGNIISFAYLNLAAVIINVVLNIILIPLYGALGCCYAALASQLFCGIATMVFVNRRSGISYQLNLLALSIITALALGFFYYKTNELAISKWVLLVGAGMLTLLIAIFSNYASVKAWLLSFQRLNKK